MMGKPRMVKMVREDGWYGAVHQLVRDKHPAMRPWIVWRLSGFKKYLNRDEQRAFSSAVAMRMKRNREG